MMEMMMTRSWRVITEALSILNQKVQSRLQTENLKFSEWSNPNCFSNHAEDYETVL